MLCRSETQLLEIYPFDHSIRFDFTNTLAHRAGVLFEHNTTVPKAQ